MSIVDEVIASQGLTEEEAKRLREYAQDFGSGKKGSIHHQIDRGLQPNLSRAIREFQLRTMYSLKNP